MVGACDTCAAWDVLWTVICANTVALLQYFATVRSVPALVPVLAPAGVRLCVVLGSAMPCTTSVCSALVSVRAAVPWVTSQAELGAFTNGLKNLSSVSAAQAGSAAVIGVESYFLFNVGEILGRGSLVGYDIGPNGYRENH